MAEAALRQFLIAVTATGLLAGCVDGSGGGSSGGLTASAPRVAAVGSDVEAPEVFQVTDSALWDGRPSLGGIWVASPDAVDPERVIMFNPANGRSVQGALFRRERDNPGPPLQISSDAAEALGILAGQPVEIRVTALRRVEAPPQEEAAADDAATATDAAQPAAAGEADAAGDAAATAAAATAALAATAADGAAEAAADGAEAAASADAAGEGVATAEEAPRKKTWRERRAEARAEREARKAAAAAAKAAEDAAAAEAAGGEGVSVEAAGVAAVETAPLDARTPEASAPPPAAEAASPAAEASPAPAAGGRVIQIASFSQEENASRAVEALAKIGIVAEVRGSDRNGTKVWGVIARGDAAMLASIKAAGFADAYFLQ